MTRSMSSRKSSTSQRQSSSVPKRRYSLLPVIHEDSEVGKVRRNPPRAAKNNTGFRFVDEKNAQFARDAAKAKNAAPKKTRAVKKEKNPKSYSDSRSKSRKSTSKYSRY